MAASRGGRVTPSFTNVDPETAEEFRRRGSDPLDIDRCMENFLSALYANLPLSPVSAAASLAFCREDDDDGGGADRISGLPDALLRDIVSRLPVKDAARTAALAARWREVWRSAPLVLVDAHLSADGDFPPADTPDVAAAVSCVLAPHPGPFRCVHLLRSRMGDARRLADLGRWLRRLAAGGIQELVLVNRPWPRDVPLPAALFDAAATLTRLYIGVWKFPDTAAAAGLRGVSFPHLRELGLCCVQVENGDIDAVVARSPVLEILNIQANIKADRLRIVSQSLRCVQVCHSVTLMESIAVVNAPRLERLILSEHSRHAHDDHLCTRVKIGNAPKLRLFGYLDPWKHALEIHDTVITAGIGASASMILTSVKVMSLKVRFGVHDDINMVPAFLRCFPNVEALHITSAKCDQPAGNGMLAHKFWKTQAGPIVSVLLRIKVMTFSEFRGEQYELSFLQYFFESARMLKYATIMMANREFTSLSVNEMFSSLKNLNRTKWATGFDLVIGGSHGPEGGPHWTFQRGANFCDEDPFEPLKISTSPASTDQEKPQAGKHRN